KKKPPKGFFLYLTVRPIKHNIPWAHRENDLRPFLRLQPQKSTSYPQKTARNRSGEFYGGE
ncbi:TPA: hypothetical protein ACN9X5_005396, partial [Escherichia coli]